MHYTEVHRMNKLTHRLAGMLCHSLLMLRHKQILASHRQFGLRTLTSVLLLMSASVYATPDIQVPAADKPAWTLPNYSSITGLDFIGLSQLWVARLPQADQQSVAEACTDGLGKVSEYFSVKIASTSSASQVVVNEQFQGQFSVNTEKFSTVNLSGIHMSESYSEVVDAGEYIQSYCLYRLTRQQVSKVQQQLEAEQQEIQLLIAAVGKALLGQNMTQAKIKLALLKGKQNVSSELKTELTALVEELSASTISVELLFSQQEFAANDIVGVQLQSNQNLYIYKFIDDGRFFHMLLPSPTYGFNLIRKDQSATFPTPKQKQRGSFYKLPRLSQLNAAPTLYVVASKKRLLTPFAQSSFNRYVINDKPAFNTFIDVCKLDKSCVVLEREVALASNDIPLDIQHFALQVNQTEQPNLARVLKANLLEQGFSFNEQGFDLIVNLEYKKIFSKKLDADMFVGELVVLSQHPQQQKQVLKLRHSGIYDQNRLESYLESMLRSASVKLLQQVEKKQGDI